jgi:hypothetical protein
MNARIHSIIFLISFSFSLAMAQVPAPAPKQAGPIVLRNGTIHVGNGRILENANLVFDQGMIVGVETDAGQEYDPATYTVYDIPGQHVYPGLILPVSSLGLEEIGSVRATVDSRETGTLNPNVSSIVAYNTDSEVIPVLRSNGILLAQVMPSGGLLSGSSSVVQLDAWNWEDAIVVRDHVMHLNWPREYGRSGRGRFSNTSNNSGYDDQVQRIKDFFEAARSYCQIDTPENQNLKLEAVRGLFDGHQKLFLSASSPETIVESVGILKDLGIRDLVLVDADEDAWLVRDFLKSHDVPLILSTFHRMPKRKDLDVRLPFKLPAMFKKEGFLVAFSYPGATGAMNYPFVAGAAVPYGLNREEALQMVTLDVARILGIDDRLGSLEVGKEAYVVVSEDDLLDITTHNVTRAFIQGREIDLDSRHKYLYRKYRPEGE